MPTDFRLFSFQEDAVDELSSAALQWVSEAARSGPPKYGARTIPFVGQLRAITGSGKTPVLASTVGRLGDGVVIWTTRMSAVVEQTYNNLRGRYRSLLPPDTKVVRSFPGQQSWRDLVGSTAGLTIWVITVGSWNEAESAKLAGSPEARLNLHRLHPDWAGDSSPWDQLRQRLQRPLWVVSDESHNQSVAQVGQLTDLNPAGMFLASATPVLNETMQKWDEALTDDPWRALSDRGVVKIRTRDVVDAGLLKTTVELVDFRSGQEESLDGALATLRDLEEEAAMEGANVTPRAIYVVERSNPPRGSKDPARPVAIWNYLRGKGVPPDSIAVFTDTKVLPEDAERVTSLDGLQDRHRHIIFNQSLQEGWDDPQAFVCYFDGVTKSFTRIRQIVGRVLRQPSARRLEADALNTATLIINTSASSYTRVVSELRAELRLYAPEDEPDVPLIRLKTRKEPLDAINVKASASALSLPNWSLKAPDMTEIERRIRLRTARAFKPGDLEAAGTGSKTVMSLEHEQIEAQEYLKVLRSARTRNDEYLRRRIRQLSRPCLNAIHPDTFVGDGFVQYSCAGSAVQAELDRLASEVVDLFEAGVSFQPNPDPEETTWKPGEHRPGANQFATFKNAAHERYAVKGLNADETEFALALDERDQGMWCRNPAISGLGYAIPLPRKVGESSRFFPDFIWWLDNGDTFAIDTTGRHLLDEKIRAKLLALDMPRIALITRGTVDLEKGASLSREGWSLIRARPGYKASNEPFAHLPGLFEQLVS